MRVVDNGLDLNRLWVGYMVLSSERGLAVGERVLLMMYEDDEMVTCEAVVGERQNNGAGDFHKAILDKDTLTTWTPTLWSEGDGDG